MMLFKHFPAEQHDHITDEKAMKKYNEYKVEFKLKQLNEFFMAHKKEEWYVRGQWSHARVRGHGFYRV